MHTPGTEPFDSNRTSGTNPTAWTLTAPSPAFRPLREPLQTDVLVIGAGIAGLSTAYNLARNGKRVVVVEDGYAGSGETGRTTAHLTYSLGDRYSDLEQLFGEEKTRLIGESHKAAIDFIKATISREQIECHFKTVDGYLFAHPSDTDETLLKEVETMRRLGLPASLGTGIPQMLHSESRKYLCFPDQAQFHPLLYLDGLAKAIERMGGKVCTQSKADDITPHGANVNGFPVSAKYIVVATNTAVNNNKTLRLQPKQWAYRTYAIAARIPKGSMRPMLWWDTGDKDSIWIAAPYHYVRTEAGPDGHDLLIVGGEDHRTGQDYKEEITQKERYSRLHSWAKAHFPDVGDIAAQWSGQTLYTIDGIGLIGRNPGESNMFLISGDCGNGITNGTIGAMLITDLINDEPNAWESIYDPCRSMIKQAPGDYLHEVGDMIAQYGSWLTPGDHTKIDELRPGQGAVIRDGLKKIAVYRDGRNQLHACSAVCPHLGGILEWNADERTFDCPLHGSRFTVDGTVINGPANGGLERIPPPTSDMASNYREAPDSRPDSHEARTSETKDPLAYEQRPKDMDGRDTSANATRENGA